MCDALRVIPATLLKVTLLHGCFSRFLYCQNDTKSRNASYIPAGCLCVLIKIFLPFLCTISIMRGPTLSSWIQKSGLKL